MYSIFAPECIRRVLSRASYRSALESLSCKLTKSGTKRTKVW